MNVQSRLKEFEQVAHANAQVNELGLGERVLAAGMFFVVERVHGHKVLRREGYYQMEIILKRPVDGRVYRYAASGARRSVQGA